MRINFLKLPFRSNEDESKEDSSERYSLLSEIIEEFLVHQYYFLTKREALKCSLFEFWKMDTYHIAWMLEWEREAIKKEKEEIEEAKAGKTNKSFPVKNDPETESLVNRLSGRSSDDDDDD